MDPPLLKLYFYDPINSLKITCLLLYAALKLKPMCTRKLLHVSLHTSRNVHKNKKNGVFLNESQITWLLAFHMLGNALNWPFITYWWAIYWSSWMNWRRRTFESKETIVQCCPIFAYAWVCIPLSFWAHILSLPKISISL